MRPSQTPWQEIQRAHVGQMGTGVFRRALEADVDVVIAGRACDTGIFAALPMLLGFPTGLAMHMAKIIECASLCCLPGGIVYFFYRPSGAVGHVKMREMKEEFATLEHELTEQKD